MANRTDLLALKARVDAAARPDRGLDADIWDALDNRKRVVPAYTASVDDAIALVGRVMPEYSCALTVFGDGSAAGAVAHSDAHAATPALALVSALLAALIAQQEQDQ